MLFLDNLKAATGSSGFDPMTTFKQMPYRKSGSRELSPGPFHKTLFRITVAVLFILTAVSIPDSPAGGIQSFKDDPGEPWHISADKITYDDHSNRYLASGNVSITKKEKKLSADFVRFDQQTSKVLAAGHVFVAIGDDVLTGEKLEMDLNTEIGTLYDGTVFLKANHFYIKGNKIQKIDKDAYASDTACFTTCDGEDPAWKITGKNLKVTIEGYAFVSHTTLWAKNLPVLYMPWLVFPAKTKRQSGLLAPQFGYSDRKGLEYAQPLFWAISPSSDATFYLHHMEYRGEKLGAEYRYVLDEFSKGTLMYDFLDDRQTDNGRLPEDEDWGYFDDSATRPNSDRYWFRLKHDQAVFYGFSAKVDLDIVSDQDYLSEFKEGYTGFDETNDFFNGGFGRELDPYDDPVRTNRLNLNRGWPQYNLNAELRWYDDVVNRRRRETDPTLQRLPFVEFNASKQQVLDSVFFFDLDSEYNYFYREDGQRGQRLDAYPRIYLPYRHKNYFSVEPSLGLRETVWYSNSQGYNPQAEDRFQSRELFDVAVDLSSEVFKLYTPAGQTIDRIKHAVRPRITYSYVPDTNQDKYPLFDGIDRIANQNLLTYSLTNTFTSRSNNIPAGNAGSGTGGGGDAPGYTYQQFCRFKLEQSFDIDEARKDDPSRWAGDGRKQPFSPIYGELELTPFKYLALQGDAQWSVYRSSFVDRNLRANLSDHRGDALFLEHRYTRDQSESIYADLLLSLTERVWAYAEFEKNLHDDRSIKSGISVLYKTQCWSVDLGYAYEDGKKFAFMVNLYGIGGAGARSGIRRKIADPFER